MDEFAGNKKNTGNAGKKKLIFARSVFARYMIAFVVLILLSFLTLSLIVSNQISDYLREMKNGELSRFASAVRGTIGAAYEKSEQDEFSAFVNKNLGKLNASINGLIVDDESGMDIILADVSGKILLSAKSHVNRSKMLSGETVESVLYGQFDNSEPTFLDGTLFTPCYVRAEAVVIEGKGIGLVFVTTQTGENYEYITSTVKTIIMTCMWIMCGAIIASYFISDRVVRPLRQLGRAVKAFADGKLDTRVPVIGNDEVADLAKAFNEMAESLEHNEITRRTFLANVSHDMRTPMTTIGGFIDAILDGTIPPDQYEHYLGIVSSEIKRLSRLVSTLLDISKIQAGERKFTMEPFDLAELARQILISLEQRIDDKKLDVEFDCEEDRMIAVADRDSIYQVLYNICDNGVKFSFEGGKYRIRLRYAGEKINVSVYNEGIGIPSDELPYVFDRFYKSDKSRGLDKTGVGLGMFISRTIIESHGEKINVASVQGKFCEFSFTLKKGA